MSVLVRQTCTIYPITYYGITAKGDKRPTFPRIPITAAVDRMWMSCSALLVLVDERSVSSLTICVPSSTRPRTVATLLVIVWFWSCKFPNVVESISSHSSLFLYNVFSFLSPSQHPTLQSKRVEVEVSTGAWYNPRSKLILPRYAVISARDFVTARPSPSTCSRRPLLVVLF